MKKETCISCLPSSEPAKLMSLLALAGGAIALPQSGYGDIYYQDWSTSPQQVGFASGNTSYTLDLPGTAQLTFSVGRYFTHTASIHTTQVLWVAKTFQGAGVKVGADGLAHVFAKSDAWDTLHSTKFHVYAGTATYFTHTGQSASGYLAIVFDDSTQGGATRYGWVQVVFTNGNLIDGQSAGPNITLLGWAYDNTGNTIVMGDTGVPEPQPAALLALGAMTLGASGVRRWRRNRLAPAKS